jgi:hypothetical protein
MTDRNIRKVFYVSLKERIPYIVIVDKSSQLYDVPSLQGGGIVAIHALLNNNPQLPPIDLVLSQIPDAKSSFRGYTARCPAHNDKNPSLEIWEDEKDGHVGLMCYAGCNRKAICDALSIEEADLYNKDQRYKARAPREKIDLLDLAVNKIIPPAFLSNLGLLEMKNGGIQIPYTTMEGKEYSHARIRTALKAKDGTKWEKGAKSIPYGLDRLAVATDYLTIVEGESDCWTLWLHGLPSLGLPGAKMFNCIQSEHVESFPSKIYVLLEPDEAGKQFVTKIAKRLTDLGYQGEVSAINLRGSHDAKDPNDLHKMLHAEGRLSSFKDEWQKALDHAISIDTEDENEENTDLPRVILGGQLRDNRDESLQYLGKSEELEPTIFVQSGRLVQIGRDKEHKAVIMHMGIPEIKNALTKACDFFTLRKVPNTENEYVPKPASPPKEIAEAILALSPSKWPFKQLDAIVETPVVRPDGTILQNPGYDEVTKLYYAPHKGMQECKVSDCPSKKEVQNARAILEDIIDEFPFVDQSDMANMLALMFTPIIRPAIKRHVPLALIDAPKQASGKGLLADIVSIIATGEAASILTAPGNDEEWRKEITSILMRGSTIISIDNLPSRLQSSKLDAVLTADWWIDRLLGGNTMVKVPQRATWMATGNNIKVGGDLARRCYRIRIDPKMSKPWTRAGFKHEDLATFVSEHRAEIIAAILTLVRSWFVADCPIDKTILSMATFTGWARMTGSILKHAGIEGFLGNLNKLYDEMDVENAQWALFLQAWKDTFGEKAIPVKMLVASITEEPKQEDMFTGGDENVTGGALAEFLPDNLQTALKEKPKSFNIILGKALEKRHETCFGDNNLRLEKVRNTDAKQWEWKVVTGGTGGDNSPLRTEKMSLDSSGKSNEEKGNAKTNSGLDDYPYHPYEKESSNGKNGTNLGEKPSEAGSSNQQESVFSEQPPVNQKQPPVNLDALPALARRLYVDLVGSVFNERPSTIYRGEYLPLSEFYKCLVADLASTNEAISQTALAILQKKLAEVK